VAKEFIEKNKAWTLEEAVSLIFKGHLLYNHTLYKEKLNQAYNYNDMCNVFGLDRDEYADIKYNTQDDALMEFQRAKERKYVPLEQCKCGEPLFSKEDLRRATIVERKEQQPINMKENDQGEEPKQKKKRKRNRKKQNNTKVSSKHKKQKQVEPEETTTSK